MTFLRSDLQKKRTFYGKAARKCTLRKLMANSLSTILVTTRNSCRALSIAVKLLRPMTTTWWRASLVNRLSSNLYAEEKATFTSLSYLPHDRAEDAGRLPLLQRPLPHHRSGQVGQRRVCDLHQDQRSRAARGPCRAAIKAEAKS